MSSVARGAARWTLVLPVQRATHAKSRLVAPGGVDHAQLARSMAMDTLAAVRACARVSGVIVVSSDADVAAAALDAGDELVADVGAGLGAAVTTGVAHALQSAPGAPLGVLLADLPSLTPDDLALALDAAAAHRAAFVPDADGAGTVLLTAREGRRLHPSFGPGSATRHAALGAARLDLDLPRLRRDVDTAEDLIVAHVLGLGPSTTQTLRAPKMADGAR